MKALFAILPAMITMPAIPAPSVPAAVTRQLPPDYVVLAEARLSAGQPARSFEIVALAQKDEEARAKAGDAPSRPLLIFEQRGESFVPVGRNDYAVLQADQGGQCDPFLDGDGTIAVKGRYFTVENGVACGQHWTDYITFRLDERAGFVFDNERMEAWVMNPSTAPDADALVRDGPQHVRRDKPGHITPFAAWRPQ